MLIIDSSVKYATNNAADGIELGRRASWRGTLQMKRKELR
jgi:hypothetical protein